MPSMVVNSLIFKAYDIRGLYPDEVNKDIAFKIGQAYIKYTGAKSVVIGRDMRTSTPELFDAVSDGVMAAGARVIDVGLVATPEFYFAVVSSDAQGGIMVTASHNPGQYNGFKMVRADAMPIGAGSGMEEIRDLVLKSDKISKPRGSLIETDVLENYLDKVFSLIDVSKINNRLRAVVDTGNGMAGIIQRELWKRLQARVAMQHLELDGNFPNHEANPLKEENVRDVAERVRRESSDLGIAFDGDGDRVGFVDEKGELVRGDLIIALIAPYLISSFSSDIRVRSTEWARSALGASGPTSSASGVNHASGPTILSDIRCSKVVADEVTKFGGQHLTSKVGHAFIKHQMRASGAVFAGELSMHFYFRDFYGVECSDLAMLHILKIMSESGKKLSELIAPLKRYYHSGEINFAVEDKDSMLKKLEQHFAALNPKISYLDGLRLDFEDQKTGEFLWWFNARPSNTEPLLRLNMEARTPERLDVKLKELTNLIKYD